MKSSWRFRILLAAKINRGYTDSLPAARQHGAQGIAAISAFTLPV